jgi:AcrR family transcriptional regulator
MSKRIIKQPSERLNEILDVAEDLFAKKGYENTTINDILEVLQVSKGALYHYFKSKEEVMYAVINRIVDNIAERANHIVENQTLGAQEKMQLMLIAINNQGISEDELFDELHQPSNAQMRQTAILETVKKVAPILAKVVEQGVKEGIYTSSYPLETMEFLLSAIQFYLFISALHLAPEEMKTRMFVSVRMFEMGLGAKEGSFAFMLNEG